MKIPSSEKAGDAREVARETVTQVIVPGSPALKPGRLAGWLIALNGKNEDYDFRLVVGENEVGTAPECRVVLRDNMLSRRHCLITCQGGHFTIEDLGSRNGVFVRGHRISKELLADGEVIRLGDIELQLRSR